jgi:hypothetical protein
MNIEIGKSYATRDGQTVRIEAETEILDPRTSRTYQMRGVRGGSITYYSAKGRFAAHPHRLDLVAEINCKGEN